MLFFAEAAVDFKHAFQAADNQAFANTAQARYAGKAEYLSIVMSNEGFCRRAAGNRVHHRGFDFEIMLAHHKITHGLDDLAAFDKGIARFFVGNQIDIALAVFGFLIAQPLCLSGSGRKDLDNRRMSDTRTVSSPWLVLNKVPSAPTMSPKSRWLKSSKTSWLTPLLFR